MNSAALRGFRVDRIPLFQSSQLVPQANAAPEQDRRNRDMEMIDQPSLKIFAYDGRPAALVILSEANAEAVAGGAGDERLSAARPVATAPLAKPGYAGAAADRREAARAIDNFALTIPLILILIAIFLFIRWTRMRRQDQAPPGPQP